MRRTDDLLLAYLVARRRPTLRGTVKEVLARRASSDEGSSGSVAQALIRAKALTPQEYVHYQSVLEQGRRACAGCGRSIVALSGGRPRSRRCPCGQVLKVPAASQGSGGEPPRTRAEPATDERARDTGARARAETTSDRVRSTSSGKIPRRIGRYTVLGHVGDGGMGVIFKVQDPASNRIVALKVLRRGASDDAEERFRRETESVAKLRHPAIIQVHDVGKDDKGRPFFTMDFVEGQELNKARRSMERPRFLEVVATVADALHHAHELGIVHRDVKPQNILVDSTGQVKVADFGLARDLERSSLTEDGDLVGTPLFMSPEQLRGDPTAIDRRTDVYALGVLLYEGLTDALPIEAKSLLELQRRVESVRPLAPSQLRPDVPRELDRIVLKALEKKVEDRYQTALEVALDLRRVLRGDAPSAANETALESGLRMGRRALKRLRTPAGGVTVGLLALLAIVVAFGVRQHWRAEALAAQKAREDEARDGSSRRVAAAQQALAQARVRLLEGDAAAAATTAREAGRLGRESAKHARELGALAPSDAAAQSDLVAEAATEVEADALARGGRLERDAARKLYEGLAERRPRDPAPRVALGALDLRDGHLRSAFEHLTRAAAAAPGRLDVLFLRAETHREAGRLRFAEEDYSACLAGAGAGEALVTGARIGRARVRVAMGRLDDARQDLAAVERVRPHDPRLAIARAETLMAEGKPSEALLALDAAAREAPRDAALREACGLAWARAGDRARAREHLDAALDLDPGPLAWVARARLRSVEGDEGGADEDLARAVSWVRADDPARRVALLVLARHERARGRVPAAIAAVTQALEVPGLEGSAAEAAALHLERAEARLSRAAGEDVSAAQRDLERAGELQPQDPRRARLQARAAIARRDARLALTLTARAQEAGDPEGLGARASALRALGDPAADETAAAAARAQHALVARDRSVLGARTLVCDSADEAVVRLGIGRRALARALAAFERREEARGKDQLALARPQLARAVALAPWLAPARVAQARLLATARSPEQALVELDQAELAAGATEEALALRGQLLMSQGKSDLAAVAFGAALDALAREVAQAQQAEGERRPVPPSLLRREAELRLERARAFEALGRVDSALEDLDQAALLAPTNEGVFAQRAVLRGGRDAVGAAQDQARVQLLRTGYDALQQQAVHDAWTQQQQMQHGQAIRALEVAFRSVPRDRDPVCLANLYRIRASMRVRSFELSEALVDLAAMLELAPAFFELYDEVVSVGNDQTLSLDMILERTLADADSQTDCDPDFLRAVVRFVRLEFTASVPKQDELEEARRAIDRFLERSPSHAAGLLVRAVLLLALDEPNEAMRCVATALEDRDPPPFAHYVAARVRARQRDKEGTLAALGRALEGGFTVTKLYEGDPHLAVARSDPRFARLMALSQGRGYLKDLERIEVLVGQREASVRPKLWTQGVSSASVGLGFLQPHVARGDGDARRLAAKLWIGRARYAARQGQGHAREVARDVAAALEASPALLLDWDQTTEAMDACAAQPRELMASSKPLEQEPLPDRLGPVAPVILALLRGTAVSDDDLTRAERVLEQPGWAPLRLYLGLVHLARGRPDDALALSRESALRDDPSVRPVADWLEARARAAKGDAEGALEALSRAVDGGLRGPLVRDPGLASLSGEPRFAAITSRAQVPSGKDARWSIR